MVKRIALGVLSPIRPGAKEIRYTYEGQDVTSPKGDGEGRYRGILSSVAPIQCLIDLAADEGIPIRKLVYLRSEDTRELGYVEALDRTLSSDTHFREQVFAYYKNAGDRLPYGPQSVDDYDYFVPLDYTPEDPAGSIQGILDALGTDDVLVDVDTTGGPRDAATLTTIAIQVIKLRYSSKTASNLAKNRMGLGNTAYARVMDFDTQKGDISRQGDTYDLIDLFHAVETFTKYGKAQELVRFFGTDASAGGSAELVDLCKSMSAFSDDLALCNMSVIPDRVGDIYDCIRRLRAYHQTGEHVHRGELLFASLLDGLQRDFVEDIGTRPTPAQRAQQRIGIIRWCVSRQYLQQALSLVREFFPLCMDELGYVGWGNEPLVKPDRDGRIPKGRVCERRANEERIARIEQLAIYRVKNVYAIDTDELGRLVRRVPSGLLHGSEYDRRRICGELLPARVVNKDYVTVAEGCEAILPAMLIWYQTLISIRNESIHANHGIYRNKRKKNARLYAEAISNAEAIRCEFDNTQALDALTSDILKAMDALEGKVRLILKPAIRKALMR